MHSQLIIVFIVISKIFMRIIIAVIFQNRAPGSGATSRPKPGTFHLEIHFLLSSSYYRTANSPRVRVPYLQGKWLQSSDCITCHCLKVEYENNRLPFCCLQMIFPKTSLDSTLSARQLLLFCCRLL